ncbi:CHAD domain-containing protein [Pseudonocardia sp. KRD291]|uniref:CYTH and CHAD domain-containing protein n=1 Tax=Pseudonocardia sp. KRD291 TaxID=2792007 RepID=UPI001C4A639D|nr:CHAD domain-containing protein [Pseudonocardia sp. KRD291]MBW0105015.1 CHAD domain-containing protein [Pseudonocardia sp. KRD291]
MNDSVHTGDIAGRAHEARAPDTTTYRGPAHTGAPRLSDIDGVETVEVAEDQDVIEQERYDTADLRLAAAGITLVVHRAPDSAHWQLTLPDGGPEEQLRVPLAAPDVEGVDPDVVPEQIDVLLRGVRGDEPISPVGRIRIVRTTSRLRDLSGQEIATLARDEVQASTLGTSTSVENWSEAEVTRGNGTGSALLEQLDARLRETGFTRAPHGADEALARMLSELAPATPKRWSGKKGSAGALLLDYIGAQVDRLAAQELKLREDEPDAVHQMRVASRRIRSALRTYTGLLEGRRVEHVVAELKWLGRSLAGDRDVEVIKSRIESALDDLPPELVLGPVRAQVTRHFARQQAEARAAVMGTVDGPRYAALQGALARLLIDPPLSSLARKPAGKVMPAMVAGTARKLGKRMDAALRDVEGSGDGSGAERDEALHGARRTGKQLRYATEVVRPVVGKDAKRFSRGLEELQDELGAHQDAVVARETLRELGAQAGAENQNGFTFGLLYGRDVATAHEIETTVPEVWERVWDKKQRRWMS